MKSQILCSTGALIGSKNGRNHKLLPDLAQKLHCDGFEFLLYEALYENIDVILKDLRNSGLNFPVFHLDKNIGEYISQKEALYTKNAFELFKRNCEYASQLNSQKLVLHLWGGMASDINIKYNIDKFGQLQEIAQIYGLLLTVENVACNQQNPLLHMKSLVEKYPQIAFTFDTKFAAFHSQLDSVYEQENQWLWNDGHIRHIHINDYAGGHMDWSQFRGLQIGEGWINFEKFFEYLKLKNYNAAITMEATALTDLGVQVEKLNRSLDYIRVFMK
ncbi:MAG: Xylose isomerase protein barrel [Clostridiales bacterium]|jgi:sugar phosphate isomerase/epimerase|nr:Xylose isomerase protein barrel [Clostridiales bacterium]